MNRKEKVLFALFVIVVQLIQFALVYFVAFANNRIIEFLIIFLSFQLNRSIFGKSYHADELSKCTLLSIVVFYFLVRGVIPVNISIFLPPLFGLYLSFILYKVEILLENQCVPKPFIKKRLRDQILDILGDKITEDEIEEICIKHGLNSKISETVYLYLTNSKDDVADILEIEGATVIRRLKKFIEKTAE